MPLLLCHFAKMPLLVFLLYFSTKLTIIPLMSKPKSSLHLNDSLAVSLVFRRLTPMTISPACSEVESALSIKEAELTKSFLASQFEISSLISVTADSRNSLKLLEDEICGLRSEYSELITRLNEKREGFVKMCFGFLSEIEDSELRSLLSEREFLENEVRLLEEKNMDVNNSILAFMEDEMRNLLSD